MCVMKFSSPKKGWKKLVSVEWATEHMVFSSKHFPAALEELAHGKSSLKERGCVGAGWCRRSFPFSRWILKQNFENFPATLVCVLCVFMCGLQLKRYEYIMRYKHEKWFSLSSVFCCLFVYTFMASSAHMKIWEWKCSFVYMENWKQQTAAIQSVTEINSESNHQYSMFAPNVRSCNQKLTTLRREFLWDEFFRDFLSTAILRPPTRNCVCVVKKSFFELSTACRVKWSLDAVSAVSGAGKNCCTRLSRKTFRKAGEPGDGGEGFYAIGFES